VGRPQRRNRHALASDVVTDEDLATLRLQAAAGDQDAVAQLVELAGERGDLDELRRLAAGGNTDAADILVELAGERGDLDELRRLAASGHTDAADVLEELTDDENAQGDEE
jgi:hypothetical protein